MFALWIQAAADEANVKKGKLLLRMTPMLGIQMTLKFWDPVFLFKQSMK
jgi:hypothetical protein